MKFNKLGRSGLLVSNLALGTMIFGEDSQRSTSAKDAKRIIHRFIDAGGNHLDTANVYADGRSEEIVGEAIQDRRDKVVLATKVRFPMGKGPNDEGLSSYHINKSVEDSLRRLNVETIDLLYMHAWDPLTPIEESLRAFEDLVRSGKVRYIGVSNFKAWQVMKGLSVSDQHGWLRFTAAQYQYSLVVRELEWEYTDLCLQEGLGIVPWSPLGGGFLTGKYNREKRPEAASEGRIAVMNEDAEESWQLRATTRNWKIMDVMDDIATNYDFTHSQIALAWLLDQPAVCSVILGVRTMEQLEDNLKAAEIVFPEEEKRRLTDISSPDWVYPYRFIKNYADR